MAKLEHQNVLINEGKVKNLCTKMPNWKVLIYGGVQRFWIKRLDKIHERIATQLKEILERTKEILSWMTYERIVSYQKDPVSVKNFRPITCLLFLWKLLLGIISDDMYCFMENEHLLPEKQKGCRRENRGTKDQLLIDKTVLKDCRKRRRNLAKLWIDYRKAYNFFLNSLIGMLDMPGIDDNVISFLEKSEKK